VTSKEEPGGGAARDTHRGSIAVVSNNLGPKVTLSGHFSGTTTNHDLTQRHSHLLVVMHQHVSIARDVDKDVGVVANADAKEVI
jgi:hypothetical protein